MFVLQLFYTLPPQGVGKRGDLLIGEHLHVINLSLRRGACSAGRRWFSVPLIVLYLDKAS